MAVRPRRQGGKKYTTMIKGGDLFYTKTDMSSAGLAQGLSANL